MVKEIKPESISLTSLFEYVEIETTYLENLLRNVLSIISKSINLDKLSLGKIYEGRIFGNECGDVGMGTSINL